jgi:hypothetical protein
MLFLTHFLLPLPRKPEILCLKEGRRTHWFGVLGMLNPLESCSIGDDDITIDAIPLLKTIFKILNYYTFVVCGPKGLRLWNDN